MDSTQTPLQSPAIGEEKQASQKLLATAAGAGTAIAATVVGQPAQAQVAVSELENVISAISSLTSALVPVILGAMAYRLGIKIVNRIAVKG